jgi:hypothetical protein
LKTGEALEVVDGAQLLPVLGGVGIGAALHDVSDSQLVAAQPSSLTPGIFSLIHWYWPAELGPPVFVPTVFVLSVVIGAFHVPGFLLSVKESVVTL